MKFSCERCGKRYATADTLAPGKTYKLKCKACGHLIVVRASTPAAATGSAAEGRPAPTPAPRGGAARRNGAPAAGEATSQVGIASARAAEGADAGEPPAASRQNGYVDLFSDLGAAEPGAPGGPAGQALSAAARASLPEAYRDVRDPLAPLAQAGPGAPGEAPAAAQPPPFQGAQRGTSKLLLALFAIGVAILAAILGAVLLGTGRKAPPPRGLGQPPAAEQQRPPATKPP